MKRIRIIHRTEYHYHGPVTFGPHRVLMRPREGHDVRIVHSDITIEPKASVRWLRDIEGNSVAVEREQEKAAPISGSWSGPSNAFKEMVVSVQVVAQ